MSLRLFAALALVAAPASARAADDYNPYKDVKVGDYATYKMEMKVAGMTVNGTVTQSVTAKTEKEATVKATGSVEALGMKIQIPEQKQTIDLTKPFDPTKAGGLPAEGDVKVEKLKDGKEKIKVGGKEYDAEWTTYKVKGKMQGGDFDGEFKVWMSKQIPMGMAKMSMSGKVKVMDIEQAFEMTMEMTETGNKAKD